MIEPTTATEQMMYATARIVGLNSNGAPFKTGTGFFYGFPAAAADTRNVSVLVTNKHVIDGIAETEFVIHTSSNGGPKPDGKSAIRSQFGEWIPHPDPKVDLCALLVGGVLNQAKGFVRFLDLACTRFG